MPQFSNCYFNNSGVTIGKDAFKTQEFDGIHRGGCKVSDIKDLNDSSDDSPKVKLTL